MLRQGHGSTLLGARRLKHEAPAKVSSLTIATGPILTHAIGSGTPQETDLSPVGNEQKTHARNRTALAKEEDEARERSSATGERREPLAKQEDRTPGYEAVEVEDKKKDFLFFFSLLIFSTHLSIDSNG